MVDIYQLLNRKSITVDDNGKDYGMDDRNGNRGGGVKIVNNGGKKNIEEKADGCCG